MQFLREFGLLGLALLGEIRVVFIPGLILPHNKTTPFWVHCGLWIKQSFAVGLVVRNRHHSWPWLVSSILSTWYSTVCSRMTFCRFLVLQIVLSFLVLCLVDSRCLQGSYRVPPYSAAAWKLLAPKDRNCVSYLKKKKKSWMSKKTALDGLPVICMNWISLIQYQTSWCPLPIFWIF